MEGAMKTGRPDCGKPQRELQVGRVLRSQAGLLEHLAESVQTIRSKFVSATSPVGPPSCPGIEKARCEYSCELAVTLDAHNAKIQDAITDLLDMIERCEL